MSKDNKLSHCDMLKIYWFFNLEDFEFQHLMGFKGIVSRDFRWLHMIFKERAWIPDVAQQVLNFLVTFSYGSKFSAR